MNILVVGAVGGIGEEILRLLHALLPSAEFIATSHVDEPSLDSKRVRWTTCDLRHESQINQLASLCRNKLGKLNWCINSVGLLHDNVHQPEKTIQKLSEDFFLENIRVNTLPTLLLAKHLNAVFDKTRPGVFATISARVGSIEDNQLGGWYSYRSSKAALNMALKTLSIEWKNKLPLLCVAALHPGTTVTKLSAPYTARVPDDRLFSAEQSARQLISILSGLKPEESGKFWSWDGSQLPW